MRKLSYLIGGFHLVLAAALASAADCRLQRRPRLVRAARGGPGWSAAPRPQRRP